MTPQAFRALLAEWKLIQVEAAKLLGVNVRTIKEWSQLDGAGVTNTPASRFLSYMKATGATPAVVAAILNVELGD